MLYINIIGALSACCYTYLEAGVGEWILLYSPFRIRKCIIIISLY